MDGRHGEDMLNVRARGNDATWNPLEDPTGNFALKTFADRLSEKRAVILADNWIEFAEDLPCLLERTLLMRRGQSDALMVFGWVTLGFPV